LKKKTILIQTERTLYKSENNFVWNQNNYVERLNLLKY